MISSAEHTNNIDNAFKELSALSQLLGVELNNNQIDLLKQFSFELQTYNEHTNLVGNAEINILVKEHILDALSLVPLINKYVGTKKTNAINLIDIGSGAGFPGIVLAIMFNNINLNLIDSISKKTLFLNQVKNICSLDNIKIYNKRAETLAHESIMRNSFDIATARAVGKLRLISELALPFLAIGGIFLVQKSTAQLEIELNNAKEHIKALGGEFKEIISLNKETISKDHQIMIIEKVKATPAQFPRSMTKIKQEL